MTEKKSCKYLDADDICVCTGNRPDRKLAFCKAEENCEACQWYRSADALGMAPERLLKGHQSLTKAAPEETRPTATDEPEALAAAKPLGVGGDRDVLPTQAPAPEPPAAPVAQDLPVFDTTGLDAQTVADLEFAERAYRSGKRLAESGLRRMADGVAIAHEALSTFATLCRKGKTGQFDKQEVNFGAWCDYIGLNRKMAERLLNVATLFDHSSPKQQAVLEELAPTLLYAAAKPSAPPALVEGVKAGDITTHKQYREMEEKLKAAERAKREAERRAEAAEDKAYSAILHGREASNRAHEAEGRRLEAEERAQAAEAHAHELESRPVEVVGASPQDIARWKAEGEQAANDRLAAEAAAAAADAAKARDEAAKAREEAVKARKHAHKHAQKMAEALQGRTDHLASVEAELARVKSQLAAAVAAPVPAAAPQATPPGQAGAPVVPVDGVQLTRCARQHWGLADAAALAARPLVPCSECVYDPYCSGVYLDDAAFDHLDELGVSEDQLDCVLDLLTGCTMGKRKGAGR